MSSITKTYIVLGCCLVLALNTFAQKVAILESQSIYSSHKMDNRWHDKCLSFGMDAQIHAYDFLNNNCLIEDTEIIIISSSVNPLSTTHINNLKEFVASGGNLYLQGEWNFALAGNAAFEEITEYFADDFNWKDSIKIQLAPMPIMTPLNNNYNLVTSMEYYWSGATATFTGPFEAILKKAADNYGFLYTPTQAHAGKVICISDQDWVRLGLSDTFFENIIQYLKEEITSTPTVFIEAANENICIGSDMEFNTQITGQNEGLLYQWHLNGNPISGAQSASYTTNTLLEGDIIECEILNAFGCQLPMSISNPILIAPIFPIDQDNLEVDIVQLDFCEDNVIHFDLSITNPDATEIIAYQWELNGSSLGNTNSSSLAIKDLNNNDQLTASYQINDPCDGLVWLSTNPLNVSLTPSITPVVAFINPQLSFCSSETPSYIVDGAGWGTNPQITWTVDGSTVQVGNTNLTAAGILPGTHTVEVSIISDYQCTTISTATAIINFVVEQEINMIAAIVATEDEICEGASASFTIEGENLGDNPSIVWKVDGVTQSTTTTFFTMDNFQSGLNITAEINSAHPCIQNGLLELVAPEVTVLENLTPNIAIDANPMKVCPGTEVTLQASGIHWGDFPQVEWYLDGAIASFGSTSYTITADEYARVQARITSNYACLDHAVAVSEIAEIFVSDLAINLIDATPEHCAQQDGSISLNIEGGFGNVSGAWMDGNSDLNLENISAGNYVYTATDSTGCESFIEVDLAFEAAPSIDNVQVQQPNCDQPLGQAQLQMPGDANDYSISWMNEAFEEVAQGAIATNLGSGNYIVEVVDNFGCQAESSIILEEVVGLQLAEGSEQLIQLGQSVSLEPLVFSNDANLEYLWESNEIINCIDCEQLNDQPSETTRYSLTVTNSFGCTATTEFLVRVSKDYEIYIPNAFSPNADGRNDHYTVFGGADVQAIHSLSIFNRWGEKVFEMKDVHASEASSGWDGFYRGQKAPVGTYVVVADVTYTDGEKRVQTGDLQLLR